MKTPEPNRLPQLFILHSSLFISSGLLIALLPICAHANVVVKRAAPEVVYRTFDPANPPADLPHMEGKEAAVTVSSFGISVLGDYEPVSRKRGDGGNWTTVVAVHRLTISVRLNVVIWLPPNAPRKLKHHEEGHQKIAEQIYQKHAEAAARAASALMDGRRFSGQAPDWEKAARNAVEPALEQVSRAYMAGTLGISNEVNAIYDDITMHGTNATPEDEAIRQAFDRYEKEHPTTRPGK